MEPIHQKEIRTFINKWFMQSGCEPSVILKSRLVEKRSGPPGCKKGARKMINMSGAYEFTRMRCGKAMPTTIRTRKRFYSVIFLLRIENQAALCSPVYHTISLPMK